MVVTLRIPNKPTRYLDSLLVICEKHHLDNHPPPLHPNPLHWLPDLVAQLYAKTASYTRFVPKIVDFQRRETLIEHCIDTVNDSGATEVRTRS